MLTRFSLKPTIPRPRHVVRAVRDAFPRKSPSAIFLPQSMVQTRGLRVSSPRHGFLSLFSALLESPSILEPTVPEHTTGSEQAALGLGALALAAQDSRKRIPTITTLSPEQLTPGDVIHLPRDSYTLTVSFKPLLALSSNIVSSIAVPTPTSPTNETATPQPVPRPPSNVQPHPHVPHEVTLHAASGASDFSGVRFPAGLACIYYHTPSAPCTPLAGALRLRVLSSLVGDPKAWTAPSVRYAFVRGHDFCVMPGMPWHIPVLALPLGNYNAVRAMLLHEGLVAPRVMGDAENEALRCSLKRFNSRVLHRFGQPFVINLGTKRFRFYFVGQSKVYKHVVWDLCSWNGHDVHEEHQPFTGAY